MTTMFRILAAWLLLALPAQAIEIQKVVSAKGVEAWLVQDPSLPIVALEFAARGGGLADPAGKEGLARLTAAMLDEGAGELDAQAFQERLAELSVGMSFEAGMESLSGGFRSRTATFDEAVGLMKLALTRPRFDPEPLARVRDSLVNEIRRNDRQPRNLSGRLFWELAFPGHPYARPRNGSEASLAAITAADMRGYLEGRLARGNLVIGVVGDITPARLAVALDGLFGDLPAAAAPVAVAEVAPATQGDVVVVERPGPQANITFGHAGLKRKDPDYFAATILAEILGGGFGSRLTEEVREKRGLAYGIGVGLVPLEASALVLGSTATDNAKALETIDIIRREWARLAEAGPSPEEVESAKASVLGGFWLRLDSARRIAGMLVSVQLDDLGIDYPTRRASLIEQVTMEDLKRVARRLFDPKALSFVVVGTPERVQPTRLAPGRS